MQAVMQTCDPDGRLHHIVATPGLLSCHQPVSAKRQVLIVAGHKVPGDGAGGRVRVINQLYTGTEVPPAYLHSLLASCGFCLMEYFLFLLTYIKLDSVKNYLVSF